jgi:hypothetical protein
MAESRRPRAPKSSSFGASWCANLCTPPCNIGVIEHRPFALLQDELLGAIESWQHQTVEEDRKQNSRRSLADAALVLKHEDQEAVPDGLIQTDEVLSPLFTGAY